jgi:hypothetical protein
MSQVPDGTSGKGEGFKLGFPSMPSLSLPSFSRNDESEDQTPVHPITDAFDKLNDDYKWFIDSRKSFFDDNFVKIENFIENIGAGKAIGEAAGDEDGDEAKTEDETGAEEVSGDGAKETPGDEAKTEEVSEPEVGDEAKEVSGAGDEETPGDGAKTGEAAGEAEAEAGAEETSEAKSSDKGEVTLDNYVAEKYIANYFNKYALDDPKYNPSKVNVFYNLFLLYLSMLKPSKKTGETGENDGNAEANSDKQSTGADEGAEAGQTGDAKAGEQAGDDKGGQDGQDGQNEGAGKDGAGEQTVQQSDVVPIDILLDNINVFVQTKQVGGIFKALAKGAAKKKLALFLKNNYNNIYNVKDANLSLILSVKVENEDKILEDNQSFEKAAIQVKNAIKETKASINGDYAKFIPKLLDLAQFLPDQGEGDDEAAGQDGSDQSKAATKPPAGKPEGDEAAVTGGPASTQDGEQTTQSGGPHGGGGGDDDSKQAQAAAEVKAEVKPGEKAGTEGAEPGKPAEPAELAESAEPGQPAKPVGDPASGQPTADAQSTTGADDKEFIKELENAVLIGNVNDKKMILKSLLIALENIIDFLSGAQCNDDMFGSESDDIGDKVAVYAKYGDETLFSIKAANVAGSDKATSLLTHILTKVCIFNKLNKPEDVKTVIDAFPPKDGAKVNFEYIVKFAQEKLGNLKKINVQYISEHLTDDCARSLISFEKPRIGKADTIFELLVDIYNNFITITPNDEDAPSHSGEGGEDEASKKESKKGKPEKIIGFESVATFIGKSSEILKGLQTINLNPDVNILRLLDDHFGAVLTIRRIITELIPKKKNLDKLTKLLEKKSKDNNEKLVNTIMIIYGAFENKSDLFSKNSTDYEAIRKKYTESIKNTDLIAAMSLNKLWEKLNGAEKVINFKDVDGPSTGGPEPGGEQAGEPASGPEREGDAVVDQGAEGTDDKSDGDDEDDPDKVKKVAYQDRTAAPWDKPTRGPAGSGGDAVNWPKLRGGKLKAGTKSMISKVHGHKVKFNGYQYCIHQIQNIYYIETKHFGIIPVKKIKGQFVISI